MHYVNYVGGRHTLFVIGEFGKLISVELCLYSWTFWKLLDVKVTLFDAQNINMYYTSINLYTHHFLLGSTVYYTCNLNANIVGTVAVSD